MTDTERLIIQWEPTEGLPRRLCFKPYNEDNWLRTEQEWSGEEWRICGNEFVTDCAFAPESSRSEPTTPPTVEELLDQIRGTWEGPDPLVVVFDSPSRAATSEVVAAVDGDLRYRTAQRDQWHHVTVRTFTQRVKRRGLPEVQRLSETPYERAHFADRSVSEQH